MLKKQSVYFNNVVVQNRCIVTFTAFSCLFLAKSYPGVFILLMF